MMFVVRRKRRWRCLIGIYVGTLDFGTAVKALEVKLVFKGCNSQGRSGLSLNAATSVEMRSYFSVYSMTLDKY
jgi:hypothetical protein